MFVENILWFVSREVNAGRPRRPCRGFESLSTLVRLRILKTELHLKKLEDSNDIKNRSAFRLSAWYGIR